MKQDDARTNHAKQDGMKNSTAQDDVRQNSPKQDGAKQDGMRQNCTERGGAKQGAVKQNSTKPNNTKQSGTKREIVAAALELFSVQGYEATSIAQIAAAVGIRKASLYSHFESKQEILDTLVQEILEQYEQRSIFARADWDDPAFADARRDITPDTVLQAILGHLRYILHDPQLSRARRMLTIEQFRNPQLAALQTKQNYTDVLNYCTGLMRFLMEQGTLMRGDAEIMAAQFCLPISAWIALCDREPEREDEAMTLMERHIRQFFRLYQGQEAVL